MANNNSSGGRAGLSRRNALQFFGASGLTAMAVAACGRDATDDTPGPAPNTGDAAEGATWQSADASLRWMVNPDVTVFFEPWLEQFQSEYPNVSVTVDGISNQENLEVLSLGIQNGNAHDLFVTPQGIPSATMIAEGWVAPLDDVIPDLEAFKAAFKPGALTRSIVDGKLYSVPIDVSTGIQSIVFYNRQYMDDAGYDPESQPLSWDDMRDAARRITQAGNGDYYGFVIAGGTPVRLIRFVDELATHAGSNTTPYDGGGFDWHTGEYNITSDEHIGALELLLAMADDGSMLPGFTSLPAPEAASPIPAGHAGMMLHLPNYASLWPRGQHGGSEDFDFGVGRPPTPDGTSLVKMGAPPGGSMLYWAYAETPHLEVAGELLSRLGSPEGVTEFYSAYGIANTPAFDGVVEQMDLTDNERRTLEMVDDLWVPRPEPALRNPDAQQAMLDWRAPTPDYGALLQGIIGGQIDMRESLQELQDALNSELDRVIADGQAQGLDVSREDWVFPNWDPNEPYLDEDYAAL